MKQDFKYEIGDRVKAAGATGIVRAAGLLEGRPGAHYIVDTGDAQVWYEEHTLSPAPAKPTPPAQKTG